MLWFIFLGPFPLVFLLSLRLRVIILNFSTSLRNLCTLCTLSILFVPYSFTVGQSVPTDNKANVKQKNLHRTTLFLHGNEQRANDEKRASTEGFEGARTI